MKILILMFVTSLCSGQYIYDYSGPSPDYPGTPSISFEVYDVDTQFSGIINLVVIMRARAQSIDGVLYGSYSGTFWVYLDPNRVYNTLSNPPVFMYPNLSIFDLDLYNAYRLDPTPTLSGAYYTCLTCPNSLWTIVTDNSASDYNSHSCIFFSEFFDFVTPISETYLPVSILGMFPLSTIYVVGNMSHDLDGSGWFILPAYFLD